MKNLHVLLTPAELPGLRQSDLTGSLCVVFDVLRATSTFVTALQHRARRVIPVSEIAEALAWRQTDPQALLAGERHGRKIGPVLTGGVTFDLGNSPREFLPEIVRDRTIVATTTNGTRALNACQQATTVLAGSFLNLGATVRHILGQPVQKLIFICAGTGSETALEDVLGAGALGERLLAQLPEMELSDAAAIALRTWRQVDARLPEILPLTDNGRRLMAIPELRADVAFCAQTDLFDLVVEQKDGGLTRLG